jgi:hypothetical protein
MHSYRVCWHRTRFVPRILTECSFSAARTPDKSVNTHTLTTIAAWQTLSVAVLEEQFNLTSWTSLVSLLNFSLNSFEVLCSTGLFFAGLQRL